MARSALSISLVLMACSLATGALAQSALPTQPPDASPQAQRVLGEINALDVQLEKTIEAYNGANDKLVTIERERALNTRHLAIARDASSPQVAS